MKWKNEDTKRRFLNVGDEKKGKMINMIVEFETHDVPVVEELGSHMDNIKAIRLHLGAKDLSKSILFNKNITALKDTRELADYTKASIKQEDISKCFQYMTAVDSCLK